MAVRVLGDASEAGDVVHEAFLILLTRARGEPPSISIRGWLLRVASNLCLDRLRRRRVRGDDPSDAPVATERPDPQPGPETNAQTAERDGEVRALVEALSPRLRVVVALRYAAGLSYEEVAESLGLSVGTVKSRLARAHARLERPLREVRRRHGG